MALKQSKIVDSPFLESSANDLSIGFGLVNHNLCFQGMLLFLTTVIAARWLESGLSITRLEISAALEFTISPLLHYIVILIRQGAVDCLLEEP